MVPAGVPAHLSSRQKTKSFDQAMLQHMVKRIGAKITDVSASHALSMTQSGVVSDVIVTAAQNAARSAR